MATTTEPPTGHVAIVFTDVEGSTALWDQDPNAMAEAIPLHTNVLLQTLADAGGYQVKTEGDAVMAAFRDTVAAVRWCLIAQQALLDAPWPPSLEALFQNDGVVLQRGLRVRIGVHVGEPRCVPDPTTGRMDYFGPVVNRAARVCNAGHGGQVVITSAVWAEIAAEMAALGDPVVEDLGEHRLRGLEAIEHLRQVLPAALSTRRFPALRTLNARKTNLVPRPTKFIGRSRDLEDLHARLDGGARLVTLLGPGGTGKTRLAVKYANENLDYWSTDGGGVWFCDLSEAKTVDGICSAVAGVLSIPLSGKTQDANVEQLGHAIAGRGRVLLILDNLEQLIDQIPDVLGAWIKLAGESRFLATSQATLRLPGEDVLELEPLGLPSDDVPAEESDAVQLFVTRAQAARRDFALTDNNAADVAEIVRQLDGLPLAIELAASRVKVFTPKQLVARLSKRFELLKGARRDAPARQATLRGALEWSWGLLQPWEQSALAQCSVFHGGFTLEAAEEIIDVSEFENAPWNVDVVQELRERSLLRTYEPAQFPGELRFGMFDSVHKFAAEKLTELDVAPVEERHTEYFLRVGEQWAAAASNAGDLESFHFLAVEMDNIVQVHQRALAAAEADASQIELALRAGMAADAVLTQRGPFASEIALLSAVERAGPELDPGVVIPSWISLARALTYSGDVGRAREILERAKYAAQGKHPRLEGRALVIEGRALFTQSHYDEALKNVERALDLLGEDPGKDRITALILRGAVYYQVGDLENATTTYQEALDTAQMTGDLVQSSVTLVNLGVTAQGTADLDGAIEHYSRAIDLARQQGQRLVEARAIACLGTVHHQRLELDVARPLYEQAESLLRQAGELRFHGLTLGWWGILEEEAGDHERSIPLYKSAIAVSRKANNASAVSVFCAMLAGAYAIVGTTDLATESLTQARASHNSSDWDAGRVIELREAALAVVGSSAADRERARSAIRAAEADLEERSHSLEVTAATRLLKLRLSEARD